MGTNATTQKPDLSLGQAAIRLGYSYRHVRRLVATGDLAAENIGDTKRGPTWRISRAEIERFAQARGRR